MVTECWLKKVVMFRCEWLTCKIYAQYNAYILDLIKQQQIFFTQIPWFVWQYLFSGKKISLKYISFFFLEKKKSSRITM